MVYIRTGAYSNASVKMVPGGFEELVLVFHPNPKASTNFLTLLIAKALLTLLVES